MEISSKTSFSKRGARLKNGFMRELIPGASNTSASYFDAQNSKNATTNGAYVVYFGEW